MYDFDAMEAVDDLIDEINGDYEYESSYDIYDAIYDELCERVECGELTLEEAEIINEKAAEKYVQPDDEYNPKKEKKKKRKKLLAAAGAFAAGAALGSYMKHGDESVEKYKRANGQLDKYRTRINAGDLSDSDIQKLVNKSKSKQRELNDVYKKANRRGKKLINKSI